jgi:hypothetical protein
VKGPQTVAFNLPNDERIVNDRGTSMVMLKNVSEAKYHSFFLISKIWTISRFMRVILAQGPC